MEEIVMDWQKDPTPCCEVNDVYGLCCAHDYDEYMQRLQWKAESEAFFHAPEHVKEYYREGRIRFLDVIRPVPAPKRQYSKVTWRSTGTIEELVARKIGEVARAQPGIRNDTLNSVAFFLGKLIQGGKLSMEHACYMLGQAARESNLPLAEAAATVKESISAGMRSESEKPYVRR